MNIQEMHYEFKVRANRLDTQHYQDLNPYTIDSLLNNAQMYFMEHYAYVSRLPFESIQSRIDMLSNLVIGYPEQPELNPVLIDSSSVTTYELKLENLKYDYAHLVRAYVNSNCGVVNIKLIPINNLNRMLTDALQKPSAKWRRLLATIRKTSDDVNPSLYIYSEPSLIVQGVRLEYIKNPKEVFYGGYNSIKYDTCIASSGINCQQYYNVSTQPVDCEISETYHSLIVDIAVREFTRYTDNINKLQAIDNKILLTS